MEEMACLWSYQESVDDLKQKLMYRTLELEQLKMESAEEIRRTKEYVKQLVQNVDLACKERDEARDQLQKLLNKIMPSTNDVFAGLPSLQPDSPLMKPTTKANSCITESNSFSDTYNYPSHSSSPGDAFFDGVSSPDLSNVNVCDSSNIAFVTQPMVQACEGIIGNNMIPCGVLEIDRASFVIDTIVKGKPLPQKGKLLKAVLDAGPILQNLLVAGPLPRWRNPPHLETFQIPPVSVKGCDMEFTNANNGPNLSPIASRSITCSRPYAEMSCSSQILSNSFLNFGHGGAYGTDANNFIPLGKRQRFL